MRNIILHLSMDTRSPGTAVEEKTWMRGDSALRVEETAGSVCSDGSSCWPWGSTGGGSAASDLPRGFQRYAEQRAMRQEAMAVNIHPGCTG